jgi:hypothetical protein
MATTTSFTLDGQPVRVTSDRSRMLEALKQTARG